MKAPGFFLVVRFWIAPQAEAGVLGWLEGGHVAEVLAQPGFLWCRRIRLADPDPQGRKGYSMLYGIESQDAYDRYNGNETLRARFASQRAPFEKHLRIERYAGAVDYALDRPP